MANPFTTARTVWLALFLREALDRFFGSRVGWAWLIVEPALHMGFIYIAFTVIRQRNLGGIDSGMWVILGMLAFFLFRRTGVQALHALDCNRVFFAFRQVRPFDVTFARASVEAFSMFLVSCFILAVAGLLGREVVPDNFLYVLLASAGLWLFGLGYGMVTSVCMRLVQESGHIFQIIMMPMYLISGIMLPITVIPQPYRDWLLWNPILHGVELVRIGFFSHYHTVDVSFGYLYLWALISIALGLLLYRGLETRLVAQ